MSTAFNNFQTAITQLDGASSSGNTQSAAAGVLTSAQSLAQALGNSSAAISNAESQTLSQGATIVQTVNGLLDQIASLNGQIRSSTAVGDDPNTFEDQRDYDIDQLSQYISTQTSVQPDGSALIMVNGQALVNDTVAYHLAAPVVGTASNGAQSFNLYFATNPPQSPSSPSIPLGSGQLAALQDLYNNKLSAYGTQLDQFASTLANETNRITQSGYDSNGQAGTALFQPINVDLPISAGNIKAGITVAAQLPVVLANTQANTSTTTGIVAMNSADNTVDTSQALIGNGALANPVPAGGFAAGATLTITVNGVPQTFGYSSNAPPAAGPVAGAIYADNVGDFVSSFNSLQSGVTASYDSASQEIVFARDPANESLALRGQQQDRPADSVVYDHGQPLYARRTANLGSRRSLLGALGAGNINGQLQDASNDYAADDDGVANAMVNLFQANVGFPALETTVAPEALPLPGNTLQPGVPVNLTLPAGVSNLQVGQQLTIDSAIRWYARECHDLGGQLFVRRYRDGDLHAGAAPHAGWRKHKFHGDLGADANARTAVRSALDAGWPRYADGDHRHDDANESRVVDRSRAPEPRRYQSRRTDARPDQVPDRVSSGRQNHFDAQSIARDDRHRFGRRSLRRGRLHSHDENRNIDDLLESDALDRES